MSASSRRQSFVFDPHNRWKPILALLFVLGAILRLVDISDPPLDFHPTRQLRNALVARGIYYESQPNADPVLRDLASSFKKSVGQYEPPIIESLVAWTYTWSGGEHAWVARIYASFFWLLAGLALFDLGRRITSPEAALVALAYYLILPFAVQASRSFQPDPLMTTAFVIGVYFLFRWMEKQTWIWAVLAGLILGFAVLVKVVIAFMVAGAAIGAVLSVYGWRRFWKSPQVWSMGLLMIIPALAYYVIGHPDRSTEYFFSWTIGLLELLCSTDFYARWLGFLHSLFSLTIILLGLVGVIISPPRIRVMLIGLWVGYFLYGISLPFQMYTHSYYHIQIVPLVALGLAPVAKLILDQVNRQSLFWKLAFILLAIAALVYPAWVARSILVAEDFRNEPVFWEQIGKAIPAEGKVIALTQDYGYRLMYFGWRKVALWPGSSELSEIRAGERDIEADFNDLTAGKDYFLITAFGQYDKQPALQKILEENYSVAAQGDGYILFDLHHSK